MPSGPRHSARGSTSTAPELTLAGDMIKKVQSLARDAGDPEPTTPGELSARASKGSAGRLCADDRPDRVHYWPDHRDDSPGRRRRQEHAAEPDDRGRDRPPCVSAGPSEATAMGNVMVQSMGIGEVADLVELRNRSQVVSADGVLAQKRARLGRLVGRSLETTR